jgi:hypothetical protein
MKIVPVNIYIFYDPYSARNKHYMKYMLLACTVSKPIYIEQVSDPTAAIKPRMQ